MSKRELNQKKHEDDEQSIKDEQIRKDIQILATRLYDLRERFVKIIQKINRDADGFIGEIFDQDDTDNEESDDNKEMTVDEDDSDSIKASNDDKQTQKFLIKCILETKAHRYEYLKYIPKYPQIMKYLLNDNSNSTQISLRYLEPFIKEYVDKNPNGKIYDKITKQLQDIRQNYLKNYL